MKQPADDVLVEVAEAAMLEKGFVVRPSEAALAEAARAQPVDGAGGGLRDLRALPWTSIDNPESQDLDQIEVAEAVDGGTRLYVAIADVDSLRRARLGHRSRRGQQHHQRLHRRAHLPDAARAASRST